MRFLKQVILMFILLLCSLFSFYLIRWSIPIIPIFIYSLALYLSFRKLSYLPLAFFGILFGSFYSLTLFYISEIGIEIFYFFTAGIGVFFSVFLLSSKFISRKFIRKNSIVEVIYFILFFWFFKVSFFYLFLREASFLLNAPPHFTFLFSFVGSSGTIAILMLMILLPFYYLTNKKNLSFTVSSVLSLTLLVLLLVVSVQSITEELPTKVTFIQSSFNESPTELDFNSSLSSELFIPEINKVERGIIILPETAYSSRLGFDSITYKQAYKEASKNKLVILGGNEFNESHVQNIAYVYFNETLLGEHLSTNPYINPKVDQKYITQQTPTVFDSPYGKFIVLICFEALHRSSLDNVPIDELDFVVVISNNYFTTSQHGLNTLVWNIQDLAATNSLPVFAVSNNGPSVYVNSRGDVVQRTPDFTNFTLVLD